MRRTTGALALAALLALAACSSPSSPGAVDDAATIDPSSSTASSLGRQPVVVPLARQRIPAQPGYTRDASGTAHVVPATFTTVASFDVPPSPDGADSAYVLGVRLVVSVPVEQALSVVGWCDVRGAADRRPHAYGYGQVLISSQNPVPGDTKQEKASRELYGRALVAVPGDGGHCVVRIGPRTEGTNASMLAVTAGKASAVPLDLITVGELKERVMVGQTGSPQETVVARSDASGPTTGAFVGHGEVELTACYGAGTYGLCRPTTFGASTVWARLVVERLDASGAVCATTYGTKRWITVTPYVHHSKLVLAPVKDPGTDTCGDRLRTAIQVRHTSGTAMEIEASGVQGQPLTLAWLDRGP
ncbi:MAG: hypothetical protein U0R76_15050 [Candidatus Nanopelagicales bacterium]